MKTWNYPGNNEPFSIATPFSLIYIYPQSITHYVTFIYISSQNFHSRRIATRKLHNTPYCLCLFTVEICVPEIFVFVIVFGIVFCFFLERIFLHFVMYVKRDAVKFGLLLNFRLKFFFFLLKFISVLESLETLNIDLSVQNCPKNT